MASLSRHIHLQTNFFWRPLSEIAPDMKVQLPPSEGNGNGEPTVPMALIFVDPDNETHVYVFDESDKQRLLTTLTGGVVIARPGQI